MSNSNTFLRTLIAGAHSICIEKLAVAKAAPDAAPSTIEATAEIMDRLFNSLEAPDIWTVTLDVDSDPINRQIIALGSLGSNQGAEIVTQMRLLFELLDQTVLQPRLQVALDVPNALLPSDMNLQVMNALTRTRQQIGIRLVRFAQAGQDLQQDPEFLELQATHEALVSGYWEKLKTNAIAGRETDVRNIRQRGELISTSPDVDHFLRQYKMLTNFIQSELDAS